MELWEKAKKKGIPYPTMKRVLKRLVKAGLVKASIHEKRLTPTFTLLAPLPKILYMQEIIGFLEKHFEKWPSAKEGFAPTVLFSEVPWKELEKYVTPEDERKLRDAQLTLFNIRAKMALNKFDESTQIRIRKYECLVEKVVEKTCKLGKEIKKLIQLVADETGKDASQLEKELEETLKKMDISFIMLDPKQIDELLSKCEPNEKAELEPLVNWLRENREIYNKYLQKQEEEPKLLLALGVGFGEYTQQCNKLARMLPLEWLVTEKQKADPNFKLQVKKNLESFGEKSIQYYCEKCLSLFENKRKAKNHVKVDHHRADADALIQEIDKGYYLELLNLLKARIKHPPSTKCN